MYSKSLKELEIISNAVGNNPKYVQGGGGNTSVKLNDELMAVKASGFKLKQITEKEGFVVVNYKNIREYFKNVNLDSDIDYEKDSVKFAKDNVIALEGMAELRPSVEAGFHSILKKYVIHTHPVYANILCCSEEGRNLTDKIFPESEWEKLWIPYVNPGFFLTLKIIEAIKNYESKKGIFPEIIFMENHGLIVTSDNREHCIELHNKVNDSIIEYLGISEDYPEIIIKKDEKKTEKLQEDIYISGTEYLKNFFKDNKIDNSYFEEIILYPDQLVYLNDSISIDNGRNKLNIDTKTGELVYHTNYQEALTIEETLLAYLYVINKIKNCQLMVKSMTKKEANYIRNWESEKYRKTMA
jgi:rhamnose utilization protein RhaD (predicted bifunctional aldolase and dehydrogenase)